MRRVVLPNPPDPSGMSVADWQRAAMRWMGQAKSVLENASRVNDAPLGQAFLATNFSTSSVVTGTTTGTDLSNFVATFIAAMTARGQVSPTISRSGTT